MEIQNSVAVRNHLNYIDDEALLFQGLQVYSEGYSTKYISVPLNIKQSTLNQTIHKLKHGKSICTKRGRPSKYNKRIKGAINNYMHEHIETAFYIKDLRHYMIRKPNINEETISLSTLYRYVRKLGYTKKKF